MSSSSLLPKDDARDAALFFVVCALCFLGALAALSARAAYSAANDWTNDVTGQITIRVEGSPKHLERALQITQSFDGIASARALTKDDAEELLSPWLGKNGVPDGLPLPQMIAAEALPNVTGIGIKLEKLFSEEHITATVDDHVVWSADVRRATRSARTVALFAVALLAATAIAVIAFATHADLLARKEIVNVLHLCGARDSFIAGIFERRFLGLGLQAGTIGAVLALGAAAFLLYMAKQSDGQVWLLPQLSLSMIDGVILGFTPIIAGISAMMAARITVIRSLAELV
ncbi:cell division protein FtsX [Hirschia litorea]|uniref:Cell division protein FtsX n=1 Tax=Hirschia litorea TaxID=1199156 RepID=A0ABW2IM24_9PROT